MISRAFVHSAGSCCRWCSGQRLRTAARVRGAVPHRHVARGTRTGVAVFMTVVVLRSRRSSAEVCGAGGTGGSITETARLRTWRRRSRRRTFLCFSSCSPGSAASSSHCVARVHRRPGVDTLHAASVLGMGSLCGDRTIFTGAVFGCISREVRPSSPSASRSSASSPRCSSRARTRHGCCRSTPASSASRGVRAAR